eukprot:scaffold6611_cov150-Amphora_coffeaeformis.AAC.2
MWYYPYSYRTNLALQGRITVFLSQFSFLHDAGTRQMRHALFALHEEESPSSITKWEAERADSHQRLPSGTLLPNPS